MINGNQTFEDSNSNIQNTTLDDIKKLYRSSRYSERTQESPCIDSKSCNGNLDNRLDESQDDLQLSLNSMQLTCIDDPSLMVPSSLHQLINPTLSPNG